MNIKKIFNDPVYGLITFPFEVIYKLIDHPYFQRLRRIGQVGLAHYVYPGAIHTRFHHALGALHLMTRAIHTLREKNIEISDEEAEAVCIAILLHDIGHGPFSHSLEGLIIPTHHESLSLAFMHKLNQEFDGSLELAIRIFTNSYSKHFLHQLVSSQLDMDRMDYLNRDSFYTGVAEGVIGYDRIIKMMNVVDDQLVIEEKGIYSIEKFLVARRIMYWQVYLHKTVLSVEQMLIAWYKRMKRLFLEGKIKDLPDYWIPILKINSLSWEDDSLNGSFLNHYAHIDDVDLLFLIKKFANHPDKILQYLSLNLLNRRIFKIILKKEKISRDLVKSIRLKVSNSFNISLKEADTIILEGKESNLAYSQDENEILLLLKNGQVVPMSEVSENLINTDVINRYYLCFPRYA